MYKALALISGGLDSLLATKLVLSQGIYVEGINFFTGFTGDPPYQWPHPTQPTYDAQWVGAKLGIKVTVVNVVSQFKPILLNPHYGYGAHLNPCLDCKLFMITQALNWLTQHGFDFLITGEVVGQRPLSQRQDTLPLATTLTNDRIVRPLSARLLPPSLPERAGWLNRELLGAIAGRSRKPQIELAHHFGFSMFPQPAGGCLLTDANFCRRLKDLWGKQPQIAYSQEELLLLRIGRHLRSRQEVKFVVGRNESENDLLATYYKNYPLLQNISHNGAIVLVAGQYGAPELKLAAHLAAYFSKGRKANMAQVALKGKTQSKQLITVNPQLLPAPPKQWYI